MGKMTARSLTMALLLATLVLVTRVPLARAQGTGARLAVPDGEIAYDVSGPASAPAIVLLHGAFMDRRTWDRQVAAFSKQYRVVRVDLRPFGESTQPKQPYFVPDDVLALLDALKIERAHLVGHSFGGGVAIEFALTHPDRVASLIFVASGLGGLAPPEDERKAAMTIFAAVKQGDDAIVQAWLAHPMWKVAGQRPELRAELDQITRRNLAPFRMAAPPYKPLTPPAIGRLGEIKAPTLVVSGAEDSPGNRQASDMLSKQIPQAKSVVVPGADHALPLGWPRELNEAVLEFIAAARR
jgi:pimeloyl-ACP methyl ester carboxylesterase